MCLGGYTEVLRAVYMSIVQEPIGLLNPTAPTNAHIPSLTFPSYVQRRGERGIIAKLRSCKSLFHVLLTPFQLQRRKVLIEMAVKFKGHFGHDFRGRGPSKVRMLCNKLVEIL